MRQRSVVAFWLIVLFTRAAAAGEVATLAVSIGLSAECLAAAGFDGEEAEALLVRLRGATMERTAFEQARSQLTTAAAACRAAELAFVESPGEMNSEASVVAAQLALAAARQGVASSISALRTVALGSFREPERTRAERFATSSVMLPMEFRTSQWTETERLHLEVALAEEAHSAISGQQLSEASSQLLVDARAQSEVTSAKANLQAFRDSVQNVFLGY